MLVNKIDFLKGKTSRSGDSFGNGYSEVHHSNKNGKLNMHSQPILSTHRGGWASVIENLNHLHNIDGIQLHSFLEHPFIWFRDHYLNSKLIPFKDPWVGIMHNPPNIPSWYSREKPLNEDPLFLESLSSCVGLYTMSKYHKDYLCQNLDNNLNIEYILHPYDKSSVKFFDYKLYNQSKTIVNIGYWLRRQTSFFRIKTPYHTRVKLWPYKKNSDAYNFVLRKLYLESDRLNIDFRFNSVLHEHRLNNDAYDNLLSSSVVFLDVFDTSANNAVVECVQRHTPIICNKHPALIEYLGKSYPLYFEDLEEVPSLLSKDNVLFAHEYLKQLDDSGKLSMSKFVDNFTNSKIYSSL